MSWKEEVIKDSRKASLRRKDAEDKKSWQFRVINGKEKINPRLCN